MNKIKLVSSLVFAIALAFTYSAFAQSFGGAFEGMQNSDEPIQIEADKLEVLDNQKLASFVGNVKVVQGTTVLKAANLKVFYITDRSNSGGGSNIKRIEAGGKVAVRSRDQYATADKATFNMQSQTVVLSGNVSISQGNNIVSGCTLSVNLKTNAAKLDPCAGQGSSRVKMLFEPSSQTN